MRRTTGAMLACLLLAGCSGSGKPTSQPSAVDHSAEADAVMCAQIKGPVDALPMQTSGRGASVQAIQRSAQSASGVSD